MHRFYLPPDLSQGQNLTLSGSEAHHALHVLRVRRGERIIVLNGQGEECLCEVAQAERSQLTLRVLERRSIPPLPYQITLVQALPKGKLFEAIIQKATELGVYKIVPLLSERVITHLEANDASQKAVKWQGVALEAIKQCGSAWLPNVASPLTVEQFIAQRNDCELTLVGSLQANAAHPRKCFLEFQQRQGRMPRSVAVWIGPEGDFAPSELKAIEAAGALPISLGRLVLRTETAAAYCLSIINYELQPSSLGQA